MSRSQFVDPDRKRCTFCGWRMDMASVAGIAPPEATLCNLCRDRPPPITAGTARIKDFKDLSSCSETLEIGKRYHLELADADGSFQSRLTGRLTAVYPETDVQKARLVFDFGWVETDWIRDVIVGAE